ncbi:predicted protein [Plenodomus lingam JN3]|uniref:Predicted protein n=1 Tax=Leptosphaeria maculans (strain JN3 / isolate v23.1.3 / race Av1-4-5-6-7-8) TaxID=985895 RepID=E5AB98_LEPMJ|nr:predicted protein [Plenodomus lingam JN3]CBY00939.1 predicted protein [Plenodomus lingam JN3]
MGNSTSLIARNTIFFLRLPTCMSLTSLTFRKMQRVSLWYAGWCSGAIFRARADWRGPWTGTVLLWFGDESWFDMSSVLTTQIYTHIHSSSSRQTTFPPRTLFSEQRLPCLSGAKRGSMEAYRRTFFLSDYLQQRPLADQNGFLISPRLTLPAVVDFGSDLGNGCC